MPKVDNPHSPTQLLETQKLEHCIKECSHIVLSMSAVGMLEVNNHVQHRVPLRDRQTINMKKGMCREAFQSCFLTSRYQWVIRSSYCLEAGEISISQSMLYQKQTTIPIVNKGGHEAVYPQAEDWNATDSDGLNNDEQGTCDCQADRQQLRLNNQSWTEQYHSQDVITL